MSDYIRNWLFKDENGNLPSDEFRDQILILQPEAAKYLWDYELNTGIVNTEKYFNSISIFDSSASSKSDIKKYLFELGIPFERIVYIPEQPHTGYILTWKMLIKYAHQLFFLNDQAVWDKSLNWRLEYHHDGEFSFGKNLKNK